MSALIFVFFLLLFVNVILQCSYIYEPLGFCRNSFMQHIIEQK
jgi:hypothetical protein